MKKFTHLILSALFALFFAGCGSVVQDIQKKIVQPLVAQTQTDLSQVSQIADLANKPDVKVCADWLNTTVSGLNASNDLADKLSAIDTSGNLLASGFKDYLLAETARTSGQDLVANVKQNFASKCGQVQTQIFVDFIRKAAKVGAASRGNVGALLTP
jgi:PBP1b-binding outer membrane lipoprotein LpoB